MTYDERCDWNSQRSVPAVGIVASCRSTSSLVGGYAPENVGAATPRY